MTYKVHETAKSLKALKRAMKSSDRVAYTRFGDNDVIMMQEDPVQEIRGNNLTKWSEGLRDELRASINIKDPHYLVAVSLDYKVEKGMAEGLFAPFGYKDELIERLGEVLKTGETSFYNPVLFHYLACFKAQKLKNFIAEFIRPKKKMFIGNCDQANMELMFGPIDHYVETPAKNAYSKIDKWWPKVLEHIDSVDIVLPCAGQATRAIQGRIWKMGVKVHSIDMGSVVDAMDGQTTRTWLQTKGQEVRNFFDDTLKMDMVIPYRPGNLGAAYNEAMAKADDWVLFLDDDFLLLNPKKYDICIDAIRQVGHKAGWISGVTNRIGCPAQKVKFKDIPDTNDIEDHIKVSNNLWAQHGGTLHKATDSKIPFSGFFILTHKEAWQKVGGFGDGFYGVDNDYYHKLMLAGYDSYILPGLYGYHMYNAKKLYNIGVDVAAMKKTNLKLVEKKAKEIKKGTVSVIMMVKDEEKNLPRCFDSLKGLYDELVVVDTGSTDKTMEMCKEHGAKLYEHPWKDFSTHRNQSVDYASGEWLFQMDADEELIWDKITPEEFREYLFSQPEDVARITFGMEDMRGGRKAHILEVERCFRNGKVVYQKGAHNIPVVTGKTVECETLFFKHYGYDLTEEEREAKGERTIPLLKKRLKENPADYDVYFYLCEMYQGLGQDMEAMENGDKYIKFKPFMGPKFNPTVYYTMANINIRLERWDRARQIIVMGLKDDPQDLDLNLVLCQFGVMLNDADLVIQGARQFLNTYDAYEKGDIKRGNKMIFGFNPDTLAYCHYQLSAAYLQAGLHVMKKLGSVLPGATEQLQADLKKDCKARLAPVGLYDAAMDQLGEKSLDEKKIDHAGA